MSEQPDLTLRKLKWRSEVRGLLAVALAVLGIHSFVAKPFYIPSESMMPNLLVGDKLVVSKYPYGWSYASLSFHLLPIMHGRIFGRLPRRGDVVIIDRVEDGRRQDLIKRAVGLPGDRVQLVDGRLWLNGRPVPRRDLGLRDLPVDGNFHCDPNDPSPERRFPAYRTARMVAPSGQTVCRVRVVQERLPGGRWFETLDFGPGPLDDSPAYLVPPGHLFVLGDNRDDSADSRVPREFGGLGGAVPLESISGRAEFVTFSTKGDASWNPLSWLTDFRSSRFARSLR